MARYQNKHQISNTGDKRFYSLPTKPHPRGVLRASLTRNICFFRGLIEKARSVDRGLAFDIASRFNLIGEQPNLGLWAERPEYRGPAKTNPSEWLNQDLSQKTHPKPVWADKLIPRTVLTGIDGERYRAGEARTNCQRRPLTHPTLSVRSRVRRGGIAQSTSAQRGARKERARWYARKNPTQRHPTY